MRRVHPELALLLLFLFLSCNGDSQPPKDLSVPDLKLEPDKGIDEPFGRVCELGKECKEKDVKGFPLVCIGVQGGAQGKGFCTRSCSDVGGECFEAPNGQQARCFLQENKGDAGPGAKFCGFICKEKELTWSCPPTMSCGKPSAEGSAICVP